MTRGVAPSSGPVSTLELQVSIASGADGAAVCQVESGTVWCMALRGTARFTVY